MSKEQKPVYQLSKAIKAIQKQNANLVNGYNSKDKDLLLVSAMRLKSLNASIISSFEASLKDDLKG